MRPDPKLFESVAKRLQITRYGDIVMLVMPGEGALLTPTEEFQIAQKWGQRRNSTGSPMRDRFLLFEQLQTVIARSGSMVSTRGSRRPLEKLVRAMRSAGFEPNEWSLPVDLKAPPKAADVPPPKPVAESPGDPEAPAPGSSADDRDEDRDEDPPRAGPAADS